jgi:hypothetical protein
VARVVFVQPLRMVALLDGCGWASVWIGFRFGILLAAKLAGRILVRGASTRGCLLRPVALLLGARLGLRQARWNAFSFVQLRIVRSLTPSASAVAVWVLPAASIRAAVRRRWRWYGH